MQNFTYWNPTKLIFGKGEVEKLPEEIKPYGKNVLLVYGGGSIKRSGLYDQVTELLKKAEVTVHELAGVEPNPRVSTVNKGVAPVKKTASISYWPLAAEVSLTARKPSRRALNMTATRGISSRKNTSRKKRCLSEQC